MANLETVKIVGIKRKNGSVVSLNLRVGKELIDYEVTVIDRNGIFGLELPTALGLKLRSFPPAVSRDLVTNVKRKIAAKELVSN